MLLLLATVLAAIGSGSAAPAMYAQAAPARTIQSAAQAEPSQRGTRLDVIVVDENGVAVPSARISAELVSSGQVKVAETDSAGRLRFFSLVPGAYRLTVDRPGFYTFTTPEIDSNNTNIIEIAIHHHQPVGESITVTDVAPGIDPQQTSSSETLNSRDVVNIPYPTTRDVRNVLAYMPGLVQERISNQIHVAGAASYQTSYVLDGFLMNQPANGLFELRVSPDAVRRIDLESSRYSAQYGRASGGVLAMDTRTGDDSYRFSFVNFIPTFQDTRGVALNNWVPRATFSGPLHKGRAWFYLSQDAEVDNEIVKELPPGHDRNLLWRVGDLGKVQFNVTPGNVFSSSIVYNYLDSPHSFISVLTPESASQNQKRTSWLWNVRDQATLPHHALLDMGLAVTEFRDATRPQGVGDFIVNPTTVDGFYYRTSVDNSHRVQGFANLYLPPLQWHGRHDVRIGVDESAVQFSEEVHRGSTVVFDTNHALIRKITFVDFPKFTHDNIKSAVWMQDRWSPFENFVLEGGLRADRDRIVPHTNLSPRLAGSFTFKNKRQTKVSAGVGVFYDETRLNFVTRPDQGQRFDFFYGPGGVQLGPPATMKFVVNPKDLDSPRFLNWSLGLEQMLPGAIYGKFEFIDRHGVDGFSFVNQSANPSGPGGEYLLTNKRADHYDGFTVTLRREFKNNHAILGSYTRSSARTNRALEFTLDNPVFGQQAPGPQPWDAPNRFISWGWLPMPWFKKTDFAYSLEYHSGFPFLVVNNQQALVGAPYTERFPNYLSINPAVERVFEFWHYQFALRAGIDNITGNKNPAVVVNNIDSPLFRTFSGTGHRTFNGRIRFLGKK